MLKTLTTLMIMFITWMCVDISAERLKGRSELRQMQPAVECPMYLPIVHTRNIRAVVFHPAGEYVFVCAPDQVDARS